MKALPRAVVCGGATTVVIAASAFAQHPAGGMSHASGAIMYHAPAWSPDGAWLLATANRDGDTEVYLFRPDGTGYRQLTRNSVSDDVARWSDDGRRILFESARSGKTALYSMLPDGSDVRSAVRDSVISRTPDGGTLMFESVRTGGGRLFLMARDRTNVREIATARHAEQGSFSPDGKAIVFEQRDATHENVRESQIVVAHPDGSAPRVVATGTDPSWSRDGQLILFKSSDPKSERLWIATVSPDGKRLTRLGPGVHPSWSPDGARIAFMRDREDGGADVWVMAKDGTGARCVTCRAPFR